MESDLKRKQNEVRVKYLLIKERLGLIDSIFEIREEILNSMMSTELGCDMLMLQLNALDQGLNQVWSPPKPPNHKRDYDLI